MRDINEYVTPHAQPACRTAENVVKFSLDALDYSPSNPDFRDLSVKDHARKAVAKWKAERDCVLTCLSCPLLERCQEIDNDNLANGCIVVGVIGARPEAVRRNPSKVKPMGLRDYVESVVAIVRGEAKAPRQAQTPDTTANADIAPGDRGPRGQINDELVRRMVISGRTGDQIAAELGCDPRSVSRAKKRLGLTRNSQTARTSAHPQMQPQAQAEPQADPEVPTPVRVPAARPASDPIATPRAADEHDTYTALALDAVHSSVEQSTLPTSTGPASARPTSAPTRTERTRSTTAACRAVASQPGALAGTRSGGPFASQRKVTAAMTAVYNHLATVASANTENLLALAAAQIDAADAEKWWTERNSVLIDGVQHIKPTQAHTSVEDRVATGRRAKAFNALSAAHRNAGYLLRQGEIWSFEPTAREAWMRRRDQVGTAPQTTPSQSDARSLSTV